MTESDIKTNTPFCLLRAEDVAHVLNISKSLAYKLMQSNAIRTIRVNHAVRVRMEDLMIYIQDHTS